MSVISSFLKKAI
ncbi:unnamed protein product [Larinioides sclopetarius]|uniref:Uncharacterized protein n=1 Tax=Larinioides sclopetarius TaxID=280406 RepID=A0AAV2C072_9ARAC